LLQDEDDEDSEYVELREGGTQTEDDFSQLPMGSVFARMDRFFSSAQQAWRQRRRGEQGQEGLTTDEEGVSQLPLLEESETEN
jgi:predicted metalloendopeptidase